MKKFFLTCFLAIVFSGCYQKNEQDFYNEGNDAFITQNYFIAIKMMNKAIELKPDFADAYFVRANSYNNISNLHEALKDYNNAIKYNTEYAIAYRLRGVVKINTGDILSALRDWQCACKFGDNRAKHYMYLYGKFLK